MGLLHEYFLAGDDIEAGGEGVDVGLRSVVLEAYALQVVDVVGTGYVGVVNEDVVDSAAHVSVGLDCGGCHNVGVECAGGNFGGALFSAEGHKSVVVDGSYLGVA